MMPTVDPAFRFAPPRRRRQRRRSASPAVPPAPVLVSAAYVSGTSITLAFDRAIDISALLPGQVRVADGPGTETLWAGVGVDALLDPQTVRMLLGAYDPSSSATTTLTATETTGIVAAVGGAAWAGVTGLGLPYP